MKGLIVLEGADCSGKTTLANKLVEQYDAKYYHCGLSNDVWDLHMRTLDEAIEQSRHSLVVVDRLWISECAYGSCMRHGAEYPVSARCLDRRLISAGALTVLCVPKDVERQKCLFEENKQIRDESFNDISSVLLWYHNLCHGNLCYPENDYGSQYIRFGDFAQRPDVMIYDLFRHGDNLKRYADLVVERAQAWRAAQLECVVEDKIPVLGHRATADTLFVGERPSNQADTELPFVWRDNHLSAATYLNKILHRFGFNELSGMWVNAINAQHPRAFEQLLGELYSRGDNTTMKIVCLGDIAYDRTRQLLEVNNWLFYDVEKLRHPQHVRKFSYNDKKYEQQLFNAIKHDQHGARLGA